MNNILLVKCVHIKNKQVSVFQCLCTGDGSLLNVQWSGLKKEQKTSVYCYFTFHGVIEVVT